MTDEANRFGKRVARYADVAKTALSVGAHRLHSSASSDDKQQHALRLAAALGGLKGPLMKVAQLVSTVPDLVPPDYAFAFSQLQSDAPPMGWPFVKRRMASELGVDWQKKFKSFEQTATFAASLGQVHRAVDKQGRVLACKLQYSDMASTVEADLQQLKILLSLLERFETPFPLKDIHAELSDRLREELDYDLEAKHIQLYAAMLSKIKTIHVPSVVADLSTPRLLSMTWLEGQRLTDCLENRDQQARNAIALNLYKAWYTPFYEYGVIHGDPHLGNYTVCKDNSINLMDFGCVRIVRPSLIQGVVKLYDALKSDRRDAAVEAYHLWGFTSLSNDLIDALQVWAKFIYAPFLNNSVSSLEETHTMAAGRATAKQVYAAIKASGGSLTIPREFVLIDRASIGLGSVFLRLHAEINWYEVFSEVIAGFSVEKCASQQKKALSHIGIGLK